MTGGIDATGKITSNPDTETAIVAGGCFWGMQDLFGRRPGVVDTRVRYAGGDNEFRYLTQPSRARSCPFAVSFVDSHPEYSDVVDPTFRVTHTRPGTGAALSHINGRRLSYAIHLPPSMRSS